MTTPINKDNFWDTDLEVLESVFLAKKKITDLPVKEPDASVPSTGSVLLDKTINIDNFVEEPSLLKRILYRFC